MLEIHVDLGGEDLPPLTRGQISRLTRSVAARVRKEVIKATPRGDRPLDPRQSKRTRDSWTPVRKDAGGYSFSNPLIQTLSLEHGSKIGERPWPQAKARTVYNKGRVYSSQAPFGITAKANVEEVASKIATELLDLLVKGKSLASR